MNTRQQILDAIYDILPQENFISGIPLKSRELYIPPAHKKALQLYSNIVVGARGVGKSTWTAALADQELLNIIGSNIHELENTFVTIGFSAEANREAYPEKDTIKNLLQKDFNPHDMWKAVVIRWLCRDIEESIPTEDWAAGVSWVRDNPEPCARILEKANSRFKSLGKNGLILFDALDRLSDNWETMDTIARELLRLVLELKGFSHIHAKVFLREDQLSRNITNFPDSSKLLSTKTDLNWEIYDLHGLLWQQLCNAAGEGGDTLRNYYTEIVHSPPLKQEDYWVIAEDFKRDEKKQRSLFGKLAGPWMGRDQRRGYPYTWSVNHLSDGNKRASPRSFLAAVKAAAEDSRNRTGDYPLHYESIKRGVQQASTIRVREIAEDYPWINNLCTPLARMNVPAVFSDIEHIWEREYPDGPGSISITSENLPPQDTERGWIGVKKELIRLGIFEEMRDGRINMPDLFRVGFGLGRKGGVPPVE